MTVKKERKRLAKPTRVFAKKAKKPEHDDTPGRMRPTAHPPKAAAVAKRHKRLQGVMI